MHTCSKHDSELKSGPRPNNSRLMSCRLVSTLVIDIQNLKHDMTERAKLETSDLSHSVLGLHTKQKGEMEAEDGMNYFYRPNFK